jgi:hypothetical protein
MGNVGVIITVGGCTFGQSVDARIPEEKLQRIAGHAAKMALKGYWAEVVTDGMRYLECFCPQDRILLTPACQADIYRINNPRTSASISTVPVPKPLDASPGSVKPDHMAMQISREPFVPWYEFPARLELDKMVHVVTDGGSRASPGNAGCGALIHQSGRCTIARRTL